MSISTPPRPDRGRRARRVLAPACAVALLLVVWQLYAAYSNVRPQVLPSPGRVARQGWANRSTLLENTWATVQVTLVGFALSIAVAWLLAMAIDFVPVLRDALMPLLIASQTLPIVAIAPLMIIWFGFGLLPKVLVVALATFFPMVVGLVEGLASTRGPATALLTSMGASRWQHFTLVRLPSAMPRFFTSLRIAVTYAVVGAVFAEYAGAKTGLGIYMAVQKNSFRTDLVLAAVVVTAAVTLVLYAATFVLERVLVPWSKDLADA